MSKAVVDAIKTRLYLDQTAGSVYDAVSGRIYHLQSPENGTLPLIVFGVASSSPSPNFDGSTTETLRVEFTVYSQAFESGAAAALGIDDKLLACLEGQILAPTGYDRLTVRCEQRGAASMVEDAVSVTSVYRCVGTRT